MPSIAWKQLPVQNAQLLSEKWVQACRCCVQKRRYGRYEGKFAKKLIHEKKLPEMAPLSLGGFGKVRQWHQNCVLRWQDREKNCRVCLGTQKWLVTSYCSLKFVWCWNRIKYALNQQICITSRNVRLMVCLLEMSEKFKKYAFSGRRKVSFFQHKKASSDIKIRLLRLNFEVRM